MFVWQDDSELGLDAHEIWACFSHECRAVNYRDKGQENVNKRSLVTLFLCLLVIHLVFWYFKFLFWKLSICNIHTNCFENDLQELFIIFIVYSFIYMSEIKQKFRTNTSYNLRCIENKIIKNPNQIRHTCSLCLQVIYIYIYIYSFFFFYCFY